MNADTLLQKARQYPLVVAFSGCAMLAIVVLGLRFSRIEELEEQAARLDEQLATMQRNARYAGTREEDSAELKALLARIQEHLASPSPNAKASNLDYFYGLESRSNGIRLTRVKQQETAEPEPAAKSKSKKDKDEKPVRKAVYQPLKFTITVEGKALEIIRFLDIVQRDRYLVRIDELRLALSQESALRTVEANVTLSLLAPLEEAAK